MGLFVEVKIDQSKFPTLEARKKLAGLCPVDALVATEEALQVNSDNEDECTLCDLCIQQAPAGAVKVVRTYQEYMNR